MLVEGVESRPMESIWSIGHEKIPMEKFIFYSWET